MLKMQFINIIVLFHRYLYRILPRIQTSCICFLWFWCREVLLLQKGIATTTSHIFLDFFITFLSGFELLQAVIATYLEFYSLGTWKILPIYSA